MPNDKDDVVRTIQSDVLPDVRTHNRKGGIRGPGGTWIPIYCANCGADGGAVPEENCTFAFYLCTPCGAKWGGIAHHHVEPEVVFWARVKQEQLDAYERVLTPEETLRELENPNSPLTKLFREGIGRDGKGKWR